MKIRPGRMVLGVAMAMSLAGCMSMDEMLASDNVIWREVGETKAVYFVTDNANPLERQIEVVGKISNQKRLSDIYISKAARPEVKAEARKHITEKDAFEYLFFHAPDAAVRNDALDNMGLDDDALVELAFRAGSGEVAMEVANRVQDKSKLSASVVGKAKEAFKLQEDIISKERIGGYRNNPGKFNEDVDTLEKLYNSFVALAPLAQDMEAVGEFCSRYDVQNTRGKEGEHDFYTPFEKGMKAAFLASLTDEDKIQAIREGSYSKNDSKNPIKTLMVQSGGKFAYGNETTSIFMTKDEVLASLTNRNLADDMEALDNISGLEVKSAKDQLAAVKAIKDAGLRKKVVFDLIDRYNSSYRSSSPRKEVEAAHLEMLKTLPADMLAAELRSAAKDNEGSGANFRLSGQRAGEAITDQAVIKNLLIEDPSWVQEWHLDERFANSYTALLDNLKDEDALMEIYLNGKPDENGKIASVWTLRSIFKRFSQEKQAQLLAEAMSRADEEAKKNVVVKGYWLGMSLRDFCLINNANGLPAKVDVSKDEKITAFYFNKENRDKFLDVGKGLAGITKFASLYGNVPDGIDLSQNDRTETRTVVRSIKHLNFDAKGQYDRYRWEYSHFAKYVDSVHNFQAEIKDETGELTIRYPVDEGIIGVVDKTKEEEDALLNALF